MTTHWNNIKNFFKRMFKKEPIIGPPNPTPTPNPLPDPGVYMTAKEVREKITSQLGVKLASSNKIYLPDAEFYCPSVAYTKKVLEESYGDRRTWMAEVFDCDDHALVLKADFAIDAYRNGTRRAPHAFGIIWGYLPGPHAINFVINSDGVLRFIEPQTDAIFLPRKTDTGIWLMLA